MTTEQEPKWIQRAWLDVVHADQIRQHGGSPGVRDHALIESALARPQNLYAYGDNADIAQSGAAYAYGIARNHGFIDGNTRVAFQAMYVFLGVNGYRLVAPEPEVVRVMLDVAAGNLTEDGLAAWVRAHLEPR
jgi:death on curing protein